MKKKKLAINGFGRIGRTSLRVWWEFFRDQADMVAINTSGSMNVSGWANLLKHDSNYGLFPNGEIGYEETQPANEATDSNPIIGYLFINDYKITVFAQRDPAKIPWENTGAEIILESTGAFTTKEKASGHLHGTVRKVIISAPPKDKEIPIYVVGVKNDDGSSPIISNASCTTNCVAPIIKVMSENFGIQKAMLNTSHAYTDDQNLQDNSHKDPRRARSAAMNIVPTTTGAAIAVGAVIPAVSGVFNGVSMRVPVSTGSISDVVMLLDRDVTIDEVNSALTAAASSELAGIMSVTREPLVSRDIVGRRESCIVDLTMTDVVGGNLVRVLGWYDNEFGYCNRFVQQGVIV